MRKGKRAQGGKGSEQEIETEKDKRIAELEAQLEEMQFELDVANTTLDVVLKKYEGDGQGPAESSRQRQRLLTSLKGKYKLPRLRKKLKAAKERLLLPRGCGKAGQKEGKGGGAAIPRSSYFYVQQ